MEIFAKAQDEAENCDTRPIAYEFYANLQPLHPRFTVSPAKKPWAQPQPIASNSIAFPVAPNDVGEKKGGDGKEEAGEATHSETERLLGNGAATWRRHRSSTMHIFLCAVSAQV